MKNVALVISTVLFTVGCGQSVEAQRADAAKCASYYAAMLEPAMSTSLQQAGAELAQQHIAAEDDKAIVAQLSACIDTWEKLSKR